MFLAVTKNVWQPDKKNQELLEQLAQLSNNLYNCGVYASRQQFFKDKKAVSYVKLNGLYKKNENYKELFSQTSQQVLKSVAEAFSSFRSLMKLWRVGELDKEPSLPRYRTKGGFYQVVYPGQHLLKIGNKLRVPLGKGGQTKFGRKEFFVPLPERLKDIPVRELRFIPVNGQWQIEYVHLALEKPRSSCKLQSERVLGLDPGIDNLVAATSNCGHGFVIDGKLLKSKNQWYNKAKSYYQAILDKVNPENTGIQSKRIRQLTIKRNHFVRDFINKTARYIINFCLENNIDTIVWGENFDNKRNVNLGRKNNQSFTTIPHAKLRDRIAQLCLIFGLRFVITEESYTSKCSHFDSDFLPTFGAKPEGWKSSGRRIKRGLFRTAKGWLLNSDNHGAMGILRKVSTMLGFDLSGVCRASVAMPCRIKIV